MIRKKRMIAGAAIGGSLIILAFLFGGYNFNERGIGAVACLFLTLGGAFLGGLIGSEAFRDSED